MLAPARCALRDRIDGLQTQVSTAEAEAETARAAAREAVQAADALRKEEARIASARAVGAAQGRGGGGVEKSRPYRAAGWRGSQRVGKAVAPRVVPILTEPQPERARNASLCN